MGTFLLRRSHLLCLQSQGDDARDHGGGHGGAGVAVGAAVPEIRGDLWREELQPPKCSQHGHHPVQHPRFAAREEMNLW